MRALTVLLAAALLSGCANTPIPPVDPQQVWVEMFTRTGTLVMADRLDRKRLNDGRYFQFPPGAHELIVRYDFEVHGMGGFNSEPFDRMCYLTIAYDNFQAGKRYRLEARDMAMQPSARLWDENRQIVAEERNITCLP